MGRDHQVVACAQYGAPRVRLKQKREVAPAHGRRQRGAVRRKVMAKTIAGSCVVIILLCASIQAHHSFAAPFDPKKPTTITGPVTKIEWAKPHIYFYVDAKDAAGSLVNWAVERGNPRLLIPLGWLPPGTKDAAVARPAAEAGKVRHRTSVSLTGRKTFAGSPQGTTP